MYSLDSPLDEKKEYPNEEYLKAYFKSVVGSYCVYTAEVRKFPIPAIHGCPPVKHFKR
jgi:hypothetical protein